jgi:hypothetical protein
MDLMTEVFKVAAAILASLGGATVLVFAFSNWLGKIWAERLMARETAEHARELEMLKNKFVQETESYKIKLKKSEFLFEKEFAAASELVALVREIRPRQFFPEMEWADACDLIAMNFSKIENRLDDYLAKHGAVLGKEVADLISKCIGIVAQGNFDVQGMEVGAEANRAADNFYKEITKAETLLLAQVHLQASI